MCPIRLAAIGRRKKLENPSASRSFRNCSWTHRPTWISNQSKVALDHYATIAESALANAKRNGARDDIQATYNDAASVYGAQQAAATELSKAEKEAAGITKLCPSLKAQVDQTIADTRTTAARADTAKTKVDSIIEALPHTIRR